MEYYGIRTGTNTLAHSSSPINQGLGMSKSRILNILDILRTIKIMGWVLNKLKMKFQKEYGFKGNYKDFILSNKNNKDQRNGM